MDFGARFRFKETGGDKGTGKSSVVGFRRVTDPNRLIGKVVDEERTLVFNAVGFCLGFGDDGADDEEVEAEGRVRCDDVRAAVIGTFVPIN